MKLRIRVQQPDGEPTTVRVDVPNPATVAALQERAWAALPTAWAGGGRVSQLPDPALLSFSLNKRDFFSGPADAGLSTFGVCGGDLLHACLAPPDKGILQGASFGGEALAAASSFGGASDSASCSGQSGHVGAAEAPPHAGTPDVKSAEETAVMSSSPQAKAQPTGTAVATVGNNGHPPRSTVPSTVKCSGSGGSSVVDHPGILGVQTSQPVVVAMTEFEKFLSQVPGTMSLALLAAHSAMADAGLAMIPEGSRGEGAHSSRSLVTLKYGIPAAPFPPSGSKGRAEAMDGDGGTKGGSELEQPGKEGAVCELCATVIGGKALLLYATCKLCSGSVGRHMPSQNRPSATFRVVLPLGPGLVTAGADHILRPMQLKVKDQLAVPLLFHCYDCAGLGRPPISSLLSLPQEVLTQAVLVHMGAASLARLCCACKELRYAVESAEEVWEMLYFRDIPEVDRRGWETPSTSKHGEEQGDLGIGQQGNFEMGQHVPIRCQGLWKACYAAAWKRKKERERREEQERDNEMSRRQRFRQFQTTHFPYFMHGGEYDRLPGGFGGGFGGAMFGGF